MKYLKNRRISLLLLLSCPLFLQRCGLMSFTGVPLDKRITTFSIKEFEKRDPSAPMDIECQLTDALIDKIDNLNILQVKKDGEIHYEGCIISYNRTLIATQNDNSQGESKQRITITAEVTYTNSINKDRNFKKNFQKYAEDRQDSNEDQLIKYIIDQLAKEIFQDSIDEW